MTTCLVLGAGFIGSHIAELLVKKGYQVKIFDISFDSVDNGLIKAAECFKGDFCNYIGWKEVLHGVDYIFHNICTTIPKTADDDPVRDIETNVISNVRLFKELINSGIKKIIFSSSGGTIYGEPAILPISEEHPSDPISSYAISKLSIEKYLHYFRYHYGLDYVSLRYSNAYGIGQNPFGMLGAVTIFIRRLVDRQPITVFGDGSIVRDYIYVDDIARANLCVMQGQTRHESYNVGTGVGISIRDLIALIFRVTGMSTEVNYLNKRSNDVSKNILDISLIKQELDWAPEIDLEDGILRIWEYFKQNG